MKWPAYPEYKASGIEWLGDIPARWQVWPLKFLAAVIPSNVDKHSKEDETPVRLCNYTEVYYNDKVSNGLQFMPATATSDEIQKFTLRAGDVIITKDSETANDIGRSAYVPDSLPGVLCGYHLSIVRPSPKLLGQFAKLLFDSRYLRAVLETRSNGLTRVGLSQYAIDNLDIPLPPVADQAEILSFLDQQTTKIDALIDKQNQLIATLREDRRATIAHAVSRGLRPDTYLVDSRVEWLGEIPAHWSSSRLRYVIAAIESGTSVNGFDEPVGPDEIGVLKTSCVSSGRFDFEANKTVSEDELDRVSCPLGDDVLVVNRANTPMLVGSAAYVQYGRPNLYLSDKLWQVRFADAAAQFIYYWTQTQVYRSQIIANCVGASSSMQNLAISDFRDMAIALPPPNEQHEIVLFLNAKVERIDALIAKSNQTIATLNEYRSALVNSAVTGKIDVREAVA